MRTFKLLIVLLTSGSCFGQTFTRILTGPLVTTSGDSRSVNWVDVNNDGWVDCMITNGPQAGQDNFLYINTGSGNFTLLTGSSITDDGTPSDGATWGDFDNDGDEDCFVVNWYNVNNLFYTNQGNAQFARDTTGIHVTDAGYSETASWGDYDKDNLLDIYVTNSAGQKKNFLYHNEGNGLFTKIIAGDVVNDAFESRSVNWTDIDSDGDIDLFVTNESGQNENIYSNNGTGGFTKITSGSLVNDGGNTMSSSWGDYDNDGDMDVFLANDQGNNSLFRNEGGFVFTRIVNDTVSNSGGNSFSSAWSDIDNDGDIDLFVTNSFTAGTLVNNFLYINNGNGSFSRVSNTAPATDLDWSYGCAFGDYDNDGFQDLAIATCRFNGIDRPDILYRNDGNNNNWVMMNLIGGPSNRSAIGARIRIKAVINGNAGWQMREISSQSSYCGQNDRRAHFGLGNATTIDSILIEWPSGLIEYVTGISVNQQINFTEGQGTTSVEETELNFHIYPNPSDGMYILNTSNSFLPGDEVSVTDMNGIELYNIKVRAKCSSLELDLCKHSMANGSLIITVNHKGRKSSRKLICLQ